MNTQTGPDGRFSEKDTETLGQCRKIRGSKWRHPGLLSQWMIVLAVAINLIVQIPDWSPIRGTIALWLASTVPFVLYLEYLWGRLRETADLALRLAEKTACAGPTDGGSTGLQGNSDSDDRQADG